MTDEGKDDYFDRQSFLNAVTFYEKELRAIIAGRVQAKAVFSTGRRSVFNRQGILIRGEVTSKVQSILEGNSPLG
jgi:hypothetical protein